MKHHTDCDGWTNHNVELVHNREGRGTFTATCRSCNWVGTTWGPAAKLAGEREASTHGQPTPCVGECQSW